MDIDLDRVRYWDQVRQITRNVCTLLSELRLINALGVDGL